MKKILSIWLTIAMLMSMCSVAVIAEDTYDAVSGTEATVFGNSSFTWSHEFTKTSDNAYDGTYTTLSGGGATITATKTFYVEETKEYALNVYGACTVTDVWASDMKFAIDDGSAVTFTSSNSTVEALSAPVESGVYETKNIKYGKNILLEEGTHTITFTVPQVSNYGQKQKYAHFTFDCAGLTPTETMVKVNNSGATTIGNSSFEWNLNFTKTSDDAYDGTYTNLMNGGATITATKTFYVEEAGEYALNTYAAASVTNEWASDMKFAIDGGSAVTFTSSNSTVEALASPLESGLYSTKNIKYGSNILLDKGVHTITFTIPQVSSYGQKQSLANFTFDCATLTPTNTLLRVNNTSITTIGNSSFVWNAANVQTSDNAYDGTYTIFEGATIPITATKTFYVEEDSKYILDIYAASTVTNDYLSDIQFTIDENSTVILKKNVNAKAFELASPCVSTGAFTVKDIVYYENLSLDKGLHTITFTIPAKTIAANAGLFVFDCMKLTPVGTDVVPAEGGVIEIDKCVNQKYVLNSSDASGGKLAQYYGVPATTETVTFVAEAEGYYNLVLEATSAKLSENVMSHMVLGINNSKTYNLTYEENNHTAVYKTNAAGDKYPDNTFAVAEISLKDAVYLNEGKNTITIHIPNRASYNDNAYGVLDCLRFTPIGEDISGIEAEVSDYTVNVGDELVVDVTDTDGNAVTDVTIASSDSSVVSVGVDKKLTAVGTGRAIITVSGRKNSIMPEHTTAFEIYVGSNGVYVKTLANANGVITAGFELDGADASKLDVYGVVYDGEGRLIAIDMGAIENNSVSLEIGEASGRTVIYVWEKATLKPYYMETLK